MPRRADNGQKPKEVVMTPSLSSLPSNPSLEFDRKQAKALLDAARSGDAAALARFKAHHPRFGAAAQIDAKPGLPLGVRRHAKYQDRKLAIEPGDAMFVCSDGVFEALNEKGDLFSIERLNQLLSDTHGADPVEIIRVIKNAVDAFSGSAPRADDVTALALRWRPAEQDVEKVRA